MINTCSKHVRVLASVHTRIEMWSDVCEWWRRVSSIIYAEEQTDYLEKEWERQMKKTLGKERRLLDGC